ncbi:PspC domain-containing protein [uncultured Polaribacter sp.]|uniref:PspC domain-containing protein n=1 Tax=uncultured Polaribacter sp. TaxID=174711 RepID=UPI00263429FF|nr:PspC domain-containing protein [uncultured Polaribacter sp.]
MKTKNTIHIIRHFFERHGFGFFQRLADRLGMQAQNVRIYFIYVTFFTVGLSFGFYLTMVFAMKLKDLIYTKRSSVFDL